jgi:hypothetical protein
MRVSGLDLDIDKLLATVALKPQIIFRKGQSRLNSKPEGPLSARSGATFDVSHADFSQLDQQVKEALFFLETNEEQLFRFKGFPGLDGLTLDFGAHIDSERFSSSFKFPNKLLLLAGSLNMSLELSIYPSEGSDNDCAATE